MSSASGVSEPSPVNSGPSPIAAPADPAERTRRLGQASDDFASMPAEIERQRQELASCRDAIRELRRELAQARAASAAKSDLLAEMSHELRTPLTAIIGFSEMIQSGTRGPFGNKTDRGYIDDIIFCGRHLLAIVDDTLAIARHEAGALVLREERVAIPAMVEEVFRLVAPLAQRGRVALIWAPPPVDLPLLQCDRVRLRQILLNILSNAVKFTEPGGQVEVAADLSDGLALVVKDTGIGIEPEHIPAALSRFGQAPIGGAPGHQGSGLGLTLTKALVERHGGSLCVHSAPQIGTSVTISFPARRLLPTGTV